MGELLSVSFWKHEVPSWFNLTKHSEFEMTTRVELMYEPKVQDARRAVRSDPTMIAVLAEAPDPGVLERFLIEYCSRGVHVTEPVEGWIRRAGERCVAIGLPEIGNALIKHAKHEAGHAQLFAADTRSLVARWNERNVAARLDADALMNRPLTRGAERYIELHERVIASEVPFAQVAIELEIERLSVSLLPPMLAQFRRVLGDSIMDRLTFLAEHEALDVGHTHLNESMMERLLAVRPESAEQLAETGRQALAAYMQLFGECLQSANAAKVRVEAARTRSPEVDVRTE